MKTSWPEEKIKKEPGYIYLKPAEPPKKKKRCKHGPVAGAEPSEVTICPQCKTVCLLAEKVNE